jgi:hypothetical protein
MANDVSDPIIGKGQVIKYGHRVIKNGKAPV